MGNVNAEPPNPDSLYEEPQVAQLVALHVLQEEPLELVNSASLLWLKLESNLRRFFPVQSGQEAS